MKKIKVTIEKTATGYSAYADRYPVCSTGGDVKELSGNFIDALQFYFDENGEKVAVSRRNLDLKFSIPSLFELYPINVRHFAQRIGMNYTLLAQYVQGRKKPSEKQVEKIVAGLQEVGRELSDVGIV